MNLPSQEHRQDADLLDTQTVNAEAIASEDLV